MSWLRGATSALAACATVACGGAAAQPGASLHGSPTRFLPTLDQLAQPGFSVTEAAHAEDAAAVAGGDAAVVEELAAAGFSAAAGVRFSRQVDLATSNGPIDILATVETFGSSGGAHTAFAEAARRLDRFSGAVQLSTGPLGDEAHASSLVRDAPGGVPLVQITVTWRLANAVSLVIVRGRYGGARLDDALLLAHRIAAAETAPR